ncbi:hypothetical protein VKS41_003600 [Umbelopsis sp. WA50703]
MLPRNKYLILGGGPASNTGIRKPFTAKDKRVLREWVQRQENFGYRLGGKIYERLYEMNPRHTAEAWQNHWKKNIEPTLTREQRMAFIKGQAPPEQVTDDEDEGEDEDEDEAVVQGEGNQDAEESVPIVEPEKNTIDTSDTDTPRSLKDKQAMTDEHQGTQEQSPRRMTRSSTQQSNAQIDEQGNGEDLLYSQTSRRVLRSSVAKHPNSDRPTSTPSEPAQEVEQEQQDGGATVSTSKSIHTISSTTPPPPPQSSEQLSQASQERLSPFQSAMKEAIAILEQETSHQTRSRHKGKRPAGADELNSQESHKVAKLDYSQASRDSDDVLSSDSDHASVESDESTVSQCIRYVEKYLPWNGTVNQFGKRIYYYDRSRRDLGHDALQLMELSNNFFIELRDVSDPRWQSYSEWSVESLQAGPHRAKSMSPDSPSQSNVPRKKRSKKRGSLKPILYRLYDKPAPTDPNSWKPFINLGDIQHGADRSPSRASTEIRQPHPITSRPPSSSKLLQTAVSQHLDIIDATAIKEATHIRRALTQKTYNNMSSITDADHKRWLLDVRGLMMDYDMTAYQVIRTLRSFSGDWEAARAFLHQLKNRGQSNASGSVSGNIRIDMLLRDRDQLTRLAWSEKQDKIVKDGVQNDFDNLIMQKGRNNTLARQQFLKYVG